MYLTKQGFEKYKKELEELTLSLPAMIKETGEMAALGDRSENAGYINAKAQMRKTQSRIKYLEDLLKHSALIESKLSDKVLIGSKVVLHNITNKTKEEYKIVDSIEADPKFNLISFHSPLGRLLINKKTNDTVILETPYFKTEYKLIDII